MKKILLVLALLPSCIYAGKWIKGKDVNPTISLPRYYTRRQNRIMEYKKIALENVYHSNNFHPLRSGKKKILEKIENIRRRIIQ